MNAISTYEVFLMHKTDATYTKLVDIRDFPDLGGAPELLETTTLSDKIQKYIEGIQSNEGLEFNTNYNKADYTALNALKGQDEEYALWFGGTEQGGSVTPDGSNGKFEFSGQLSVRVTGGGVNEVVSMAITIVPTTGIEFAND